MIIFTLLYLGTITQGSSHSCKTTTSSAFYDHFPRLLQLCRISNETTNHLFIFQPFSKRFWDLVFSTFNWSVAFPGDISSFLYLTLEGQPFKGRKRLIWMHLVRSFFWSVWLEHNNQIFNDKYQQIDPSIIFIAITQCKLSKYFKSYSFVNNWRCLL